MRIKKSLKIVVVTLVALLAGPAYNIASGKASLNDSWWGSSHERVGLAPIPSEFSDAVVQVYGARAWSWRGAFAVHTWIAVKPKDAATYTVLDVRMWRQYRDQPVLRVFHAVPDRKWAGNTPELLASLTGKQAELAIPGIMQAAKNYPFAHDYRVWPGPNSNTFTAFVGRAVPELALDLPPTAIGKDYYTGPVLNSTPSGGGIQFSLAGLAGVLLSREEGIEFNLLGLSFGINPAALQLRLPGVGSISPG